MATAPETVSKKTTRDAADDSGTERHTKKRTKTNTESIVVTTPTIANPALFLYVVTFIDDNTFGHPGSVVMAKSESHARSLIQLNFDTKKHKIREISLVSLFNPSATIVGRRPTREQTTDGHDLNTKPLRVFFTDEHDMQPESVKGGAIVVSKSLANAVEILDEELRLYELRSSKYKKYEFIEIETDVATVFPAWKID